MHKRSKAAKGPKPAQPQNPPSSTVGLGKRRITPTEFYGTPPMKSSGKKKVTVRPHMSEVQYFFTVAY